MRSRILYLSPDPEDALLLAQLLQPLPVILDHAESLEQARQRLQAEDCDVVLTEAELPDGKWLDVLHLVRDSPREPRVIVTHKDADPRFWAEALNLGAFDLLARPFQQSEVQRILYNACSRLAVGASAR